MEVGSDKCYRGSGAAGIKPGHCCQGLMEALETRMRFDLTVFPTEADADISDTSVVMQTRFTRVIIFIIIISLLGRLPLHSVSRRVLEQLSLGAGGLCGGQVVIETSTYSLHYNLSEETQIRWQYVRR